MAKQTVWTDDVFDTESAAWQYVTENYSAQNNKIMARLKSQGKKISVGVKKQRNKYVVVIYVG